MPNLLPGRTARPYAGSMAIAGLLLVVGSGIAYALNQSWAFESQLGAGTGGVLLLGAVLLRPEVVQTAVTGRSAKYGSHAVVSSLAFIGILGLINFIILKNDRELDLTETGRFTLSEQTVRVLKNLDAPVQVIGFFQTSDPRLTVARDYLERYSHHTNQLTYEFHDPNIEPALARSFQLSNYGLVFVSGDRHYQAAKVDEQTLTSGLIRVTNEQERTIYFITGHGEPDIDDGDKEGYSTIRQTLEQERYGVKSLNLSTAGTVPADATVLVFAGATRPLSDIETQLMAAWLAGGGKWLLLVDPQQPVPLGQWLQTYGLTVEENYIVEDYDHALVVLGPEGLAPHLIAPMVTNYPYHEITRGLDGYQTFFPFVRSIAINPSPVMTSTVLPLLATSPGSWAETDLQASDFEYTADVDPVGPFYLAVTAENPDNGARWVVIGDAGFVTNQNLSPQMANLDLFMNAVNWLAEEEELISIRPKKSENRMLLMNAMQVNMTFLINVIFIPLLVFAAGVGVWWKRR
ncbi:MAG: Gldg family protein [Chloroflexota bacterium]